ncbi:hypothetical protein [Haemophilus paracuniculus]|uniref:hypothetical protein n=1 Tax=Haemophilus paracuniculus TaxID=734 RepID=UPI001179A90D|nr:hypothetical protein [Haemophilus paracuniculus]
MKKLFNHFDYKTVKPPPLTREVMQAINDEMEQKKKDVQKGMFNLKQMTFYALMHFLAENYHFLTPTEKVDALNKAGEHNGASGNIYQNNNGKVGYTLNALNEDFHATVPTEFNNLTSKNKVQKEEAASRINGKPMIEALKNTDKAKIFLTRFINSENEKEKEEIWKAIKKESMRQIMETVKQNPQDAELQEKFEKVQEFEEQLSEKQKNEVRLNQNFRQENKGNEFSNAKKLTF